MPVEFSDPKKKVYVEVIDPISGVAYEGNDYYQGDKFECDQIWASIFLNSGKVREAEREKPATKTKGGANS